ncbi:MAG: ATP-binding cassette domain-containing protein [Planctomycetota bacterium]
MPGKIEIRIEKLHKAFNGQEVLRGVDLDIREGEVLCIVGGSGCGKTVLINHIERILTPDRGRVLVRDDAAVPERLSERQKAAVAKRGALIEGGVFWDVAKLSEEEMNRFRLRWSIVFQRNALFSGTVYENVALWFREHTSRNEAEIREIVRRSLDAVSFDFEVVAEKHRDELSGGMAKRVALARAIATEPDIIFYDEPTTGLDPANAGEIQELIWRMHYRKRDRAGSNSTVVVTHDKDILRRFRPRIAMIHEGTILFDGPYEEFEKCDSPVIRPYFETMEILHRRRTF